VVVLAPVVCVVHHMNRLRYYYSSAGTVSKVTWLAANIFIYTRRAYCPTTGNTLACKYMRQGQLGKNNKPAAEGGVISHGNGSC
jgi:hypothetical protein